MSKSSLALVAALFGAAFIPVAAHAAGDNWTGTTSNLWTTTTNWSGGTPTTTSAVAISTSSPSPVINSNVSLNGTGATLGIGSGASLSINSGFTLAMGARPITLSGGSLLGPGSVSGTGAIQGYGTFSAADASAASWNANTNGQSLTINGTGTYGGSFTSNSTTGSFNWNGITLGSISTSGSGGTYNLNGATINGATLNNANGQMNVKGDSTLSGAINFNQYNTFNIGGTTLGAHTLNLSAATLSTVTGGAAPFIIGAGGVLNNLSGASSMGGGGTVTMQGGSITTSSGAGLFKIGDPISGYGAISGNVDIAGSLTAAGSGQTLTVNGGSGSPLQLGNSAGSGTTMSTSGGGTLDLQGNLVLIEPATANPGTGTIKFDGVKLTNTFSSSPVSINNSGLTTSGTFSVTNASSFNDVAFSTGNGANLTLNAALTATNGASINATNVTINGTGALNLQSNSGSTELTTKNLTMAQGSTLNVSGSGNGISLSGNFSYQQTDKVNAWTYGSTAGLGPDLTMTGGTSTTPVTLEAGSVNMGNVAAGYHDNFALDSLTLGKGAYVGLVDQYANATASGWASGMEALYLDSLVGVKPGTGIVIPTLKLDGLYAYAENSFTINGQVDNGYLTNGLYMDANGGEINIIGAPTPEPATWVMMLLGFCGLSSAGYGRSRKRAGLAPEGP